MKQNFKILIIICLCFSKSFGQSFVSTDLGNWLMLRPNIGYSYQNKNTTFASLLMWKRNHGVWTSEMPIISKSDGIRLDLSVRKHFKNNPKLFYEGFTRWHNVQISEVGYGRGEYTAKNNRKSVEIGAKIGEILNFPKRNQFIFSLGVGYAFAKNNEIIVNPPFPPPLFTGDYKVFFQKQREEENKKLVRYWIPYFQLQYQLKTKK